MTSLRCRNSLTNILIYLALVNEFALERFEMTHLSQAVRISSFSDVKKIKNLKKLCISLFRTNTAWPNLSQGIDRGTAKPPDPRYRLALPRSLWGRAPSRYCRLELPLVQRLKLSVNNRRHFGDVTSDGSVFQVFAAATGNALRLADVDCRVLQPVTSSMMNKLNEGVVDQEV